MSISFLSDCKKYYEGLTPRATEIFQCLAQKEFTQLQKTAIWSDIFERVHSFLYRLLLPFLTYNEALCFAFLNKNQYIISIEKISELSKKHKIQLDTMTHKWWIPSESKFVNQINPSLFQEIITTFPQKLINNVAVPIQILEAPGRYKRVKFPRYCAILEINLIAYIRRLNNPTFFPESGIWIISNVYTALQLAVEIGLKYNFDPLLLLPQIKNNVADEPFSVSNEPKLQIPILPTSIPDIMSHAAFEHLGDIQDIQQVNFLKLPFSEIQTGSFEDMTCDAPEILSKLSYSRDFSPQKYQTGTSLFGGRGNIPVLTKPRGSPLFALSFSQLYNYWDDVPFGVITLLTTWILSINKHVRSLWLDSYSSWIFSIHWPALQTIYFSDEAIRNRKTQLEPFELKNLPHLKSVFIPARMTNKTERRQWKSFMPDLRIMISHSVLCRHEEWIAACLANQENPQEEKETKSKRKSSKKSLKRKSIDLEIVSKLKRFYAPPKKGLF